MTIPTNKHMEKYTSFYDAVCSRMEHLDVRAMIHCERCKYISHCGRFAVMMAEYSITSMRILTYEIFIHTGIVHPLMYYGYPKVKAAPHSMGSDADLDAHIAHAKELRSQLLEIWPCENCMYLYYHIHGLPNSRSQTLSYPLSPLAATAGQSDDINDV